MRTRSPDVEVMSVSLHGLWILVGQREYLLPFKTNPWFRGAQLEHVFHIQLLAAEHLHWPDLDIDLHLDSLEHPERFPLISRKRQTAQKNTLKGEKTPKVQNKPLARKAPVRSLTKSHKSGHLR